MSQPAQAFWRKNVFAVVSLGLGIASVVIGLLLSYVIGGLLGLATVFVGRGARDLNKRLGEPQGVSIAGIALGVVGIAIYVAARLIRR